MGQAALRDTLFLPNVHPDVVLALSGKRQAAQADALGIIETTSVASAILAADAGVKGADVSLLSCGWPMGWAARGLVYFHGLVADVETAVALSTEIAKNQLVKQRVIPQLHAEMWENVNGYGRFGQHFGWEPS
ncbi:MAG: BMC domain-containing protein [Chloroflexota bacterium]